MNQPELFDIVELLTNLSEFNLSAGSQGTIVERYSNDSYEVEFINSEGETLALTVLSGEQFMVVWEAKTQRWLSRELTRTALSTDTRRK